MKRFKNILCATNGLERGGEVFEPAAQPALRNDTKLTIVDRVKVSRLDAF